MDIKNFTLEELKAKFKSLGIEPYRAKQVFSWVYEKCVFSFDQMGNLPVALRNKLKDNFYVQGLKLIERRESFDGTIKLLLELTDGKLIESVLIPQEQRLTGCISTQVGCKFCCKFCASGLFKFERNLEVGEILDQALFLKINAKERLNNLVFMGMGEPLDNYDNVLKAIRIINADWGMNIGARKITISTSGIAPKIKQLASEGLQIELSVSLHAPDDKTRDMLMPINKKYPLKGLIKTCGDYIQKTNRQVTFEYVLIKDMNSSLDKAKQLCSLLKGLNCKINLIPYNPVKEFGFYAPNKLEVLLFRDFLLKSGVHTTLRRSRGPDIEAACGQLRLKHENKV